MALGLSRSISVGSWVSSRREEGENEFERCQVVKLDSDAMTLSLRFDGGFVATMVPLSRVRLEDPDAPPTEQAAAAGSGGKPAASKEEETGEDPCIVELPPADGYAAAVALPRPPSAEEQAADSEAKYRWVADAKGMGNELFKQGKLAWAIRTYVDAVDQLARSCYPSRERMLWDYFARVPCAQCYSNAALCALKLGDHDHAVALCQRAMECRPEESDLVKVLLRHGQALLGRDDAAGALPLLARAAEKEPKNRAVREELIRAKRAILELEKAAERVSFAHIDLNKSGLTSRREAAEASAAERLARGFSKLLDGVDAAAAEAFNALLGSRLLETAEGAPTLLQAAYGGGVAAYHLGDHARSAELLERFFACKAECEAAGRDFTLPLMGLPLARFYAAHASYLTGALPRARAHLEAYSRDVADAGPQQVLNMPDGWQGRKITEEDRKASRFRHRACSSEALSDSATMLALIAERLDSPAAALPHATEAARLADVGGVLSQRLAARESLAKLLGLLGQPAEAAEQEALAAQVRGEVCAKAEKEEKEKKEKAAKEEAEKEEVEKEEHAREEMETEMETEGGAATEVGATAAGPKVEVEREAAEGEGAQPAAAP